MTNNEAHSSQDTRRSYGNFLKRRALSASDRKKLYAADAAGDWATVAELMGEDVGTN